LICDYGCGNEANYFFKNVKKWCCSNYSSKCSAIKKQISTSIKFVHEDEDSTYNKNKEEISRKQSKSQKIVTK